MKVTDIYEAMNSKAEAFFECSFMESYGSLMIANPKHADGLR